MYSVKKSASIRQQCVQETLWKLFSDVLDTNILVNVIKTEREGGNGLECLDYVREYFVQLARSKKIPMYTIKKSKQYKCMSQLSNMKQLNYSRMSLILSQLRTCASRKTKNLRFVDM